MKTLKHVLFTIIAVVGLACQSNASLIDLGLISPLPTKPIGSPANEANYLENYIKFTLGIPLDFELDPTLVTKIEYDPSPSSAQITWDLLGSGDRLDYVLVKDGSGTVNGSTGQLYRLYGVSEDQKFTSNGPQTVMIDKDSNGTPDKGISHITFFGHHVPDGGATLMLLGTALACVGALRRRFA